MPRIQCWTAIDDRGRARRRALLTATGLVGWLRGVFDGRYFFGSREDLKRPR